MTDFSMTDFSALFATGLTPEVIQQGCPHCPGQPLTVLHVEGLVDFVVLYAPAEVRPVVWSPWQRQDLVRGFVQAFCPCCRSTVEAWSNSLGEWWTE